MKIILAVMTIFLTGMNIGIASSDVIKWQKIDLKVPTSWESVKTPMPSLHGYFLNTTIDNKKIRFFVHAHKPLSVPTEKIVEDYWSQFIDKKVIKSSCQKLAHNSKMPANAYQCSHIAQKDNDKSKWVLQTMFWLSYTERLLISSESFENKEEAQYALDKIEAVF